MVKLTVGEFILLYHNLQKAGTIDFSIKVSVSIALALDTYTKIYMAIMRRQSALYDKYGETVDGKRRVKQDCVQEFDTKYRQMQAEELTIPRLALSLENIESGTDTKVSPNIVFAMLKLAGVTND